MSTISDAALLTLARDAAARAYAPYSQFTVGAALLLSDGSVVTGCNVENASYGLAMCAERVAVGCAVANGTAGGAAGGTESGAESAVHILAVAVASPDASPCLPCGACRQVLHEFGCGRVVVDAGVDAGADAGADRENATEPVSLPFSDLLPHAFGPGDL